MENKSLSRGLVLPLVIFGLMLVFPAKSKATDPIMTDTDCNLAIAAAMDDLEAWYERRPDRNGEAFQTFFFEGVDGIQCSVEPEGLRVVFYVEDSQAPGDTVRYLIDKRSHWIIERVFQR